MLNEGRVKDVAIKIKYILESSKVKFYIYPYEHNIDLCINDEYFKFNFSKKIDDFNKLCWSLYFRFTGDRNPKYKTIENIYDYLHYYNGDTISIKAVRSILSKYYGVEWKKYIQENNSKTIFYHGSPSNNIKEWNTNNIFWSTDKEFAKQFGKWVYSAKLDLGKIFDITNRTCFDWLLKKVNVIEVPEYDDLYSETKKYTNYNDFIKSSTDGLTILEDNWECTELYLDIIKKEYDSAFIHEEGTPNYVVFDNSRIHVINEKPEYRNNYE